MWVYLVYFVLFLVVLVLLIILGLVIFMYTVQNRLMFMVSKH